MWISRSSPDPSPDTPFRDIETQLEQFAVNARRSPGRILSHHTEDQGANLFAASFPVPQRKNNARRYAAAISRSANRDTGRRWAGEGDAVRFLLGFIFGAFYTGNRALGDHPNPAM
jgi:hypothetical protein